MYIADFNLLFSSFIQNLLGTLATLSLLALIWLIYKIL